MMMVGSVWFLPLVRFSLVLKRTQKTSWIEPTTTPSCSYYMKLSNDDYIYICCYMLMVCSNSMQPQARDLEIERFGEDWIWDERYQRSKESF